MKKKIVTIFCLAVLLVSLLAGCTGTATTTTTSPLQVTDQAGRVVEITATPQRIISLAPSNTEILYALGLADRIVGVTDYCDYPPEASRKDHIGGYWTPDMEKIIALNPDLVVAQALHQAEIVPKLDDLGITTVIVEPTNMEEIIDAINLIGKITATEETAAQVTGDMRERLEKITDVTSELDDSQRPRVFYLTWHDPLMTVGSDNLGDDLITKAGGINIFHNQVGSVTVSLEDIVDANPDVVIAGVGMGSGGDIPYEFILEEERLAGINARQNNAVYSISIDLCGRAGPRIIEALEAFAQFIHPELFG